MTRLQLLLGRRDISLILWRIDCDADWQEHPEERGIDAPEEERQYIELGVLLPPDASGPRSMSPWAEDELALQHNSEEDEP